MENYVLKLPRTLIFHKITSVIFEMEKLNHLLNEDFFQGFLNWADFFSILKPSEITKIFQNITNLGQYSSDAKVE